MQKTFSLLLGLLFISNLIFSQLDEPMYLHKTNTLLPGQSQIGVTGNYFISSNSLNGSFNNAIFNGEYLTDEIKNSVKLKGDNIFGSGSNTSLTYSFRSSEDTLNKTSTSFILGITDKRYTDISFNDDYFNLLFFGNSNLPEASLDGFSYNLLTYQKLFAGISKKFTLKNFNISIYGGLAILKGQKAYSLNINNGFINTSEYGEEINVGIDYTYNSSDTSKYSFADWNGTGISTDLCFNIINKDQSKGLSFGVYNLGQIFWNSESLNINLDTSFSYNGIEVTDFLDFSLNDFSKLNEDSLLNEFYYDNSSKEEYSTNTPAQIYINYFYYLKPIGTTFTIGAKHLLFSNMKTPYIFLRSDIKLSEKITGIVQIADGGYGSFQVGLGCQVIAREKLHINIFSSNIQGFLHNENTYNQGLYVSAFYNF